MSIWKKIPGVEGMRVKTPKIQYAKKNSKDTRNSKRIPNTQFLESQRPSGLFASFAPYSENTTRFTQPFFLQNSEL
jgi:hypothetical protein